MSRTESINTKCITCGDELHPERAKKYDYCMKPECQAKNLKGLTMVAVGVNKSAEQYMLLDEDTQADLARGKYHDQRRGTFGLPEPGTARPAAPAPAQGAPVPGIPAQGSPPQDAPSAGAHRPGAHRPGAHRPGGRCPGARRPPGSSPGCPAQPHSAGWLSCTTSRGCGQKRSPASLG